MTIIIGNTGNNVLSGSAGSDTILGLAGDDVIDAGAGIDIVDGGSGNDTIAAGSGNDVVYGGDGNDVIDGGDGDDWIDGDDGNDTIAGGAGNDRIDGDDGNDIIDGGDGNDLIDGGDGIDTINAGAGNDHINGGDGNDVIDGGDGNDEIDGGDGNDALRGGAGNDDIDGKNGDDAIDGGAGINRVEGGSGNDTVTFRLADHAGEAIGTRAAYSTIDGDSGTDTLVLALTRAEWLRTDVQADVARFVTYVRGGGSGDFTFNAFNLKIDDVERFSVSVDGMTLDPKDDVVTARADAITVTEDTPNVAFNLLANDMVPDLVKGVTVTNGARGTVTLAQNLNDVANPVATAVYTPNATAFQYLAAGEKTTDSFTYTVTDADGDTATAMVTVTITGANDGPVIVSGAFVGAVTEDAAATLAASGVITFSDVDLTDTHTVSVGAARTTVSGNLAAGFVPAGGFGTLSASVVENPADQNAQGTINWTFSASSAAIQKLAAGQIATQVYALTLTDKSGATVTRDVTITLTGTNDSPTVGTTTSAGTVTEDGVTAVIGNIAFADIDLIDTHSVASVAQGTGYRGTFATVIDDAATGDGAGNVKWSFAADNAALQDLAKGDVLTQKYTVTVKDSAGATATQVVTVTITGSNDAPIAVADVAASAIEDGAIVTGSVAANDSDVDRGATLTYALNAPVAGLTLNANGSYSFNPADAAYQALAKDQVQTIVAAYTVRDENAATATSTLTLKVTGVNDAPVGNPDVVSVTEGGAPVVISLIANDTDAESNSFFRAFTDTQIAGLQPGPLTSMPLTFDPGNAAYDYLAAGQVLTIVTGYTVLDDQNAQGRSTLTINITGVNDAPVVTSSTTAARGAVVEAGNLDDGAVVAGIAGTGGQLTSRDVDTGATATWTGSANGTYGSFTIGANGQWSYALDNARTATQALGEGESRSESFLATVTDDKGAIATQTVTVSIAGTNDAPVGNPDVVSVTEGGAPVVISLIANDTDAESNSFFRAFTDTQIAGLQPGPLTSMPLTFDPANAAYDYLAAGQVLTIVTGYTVLDDQNAQGRSTLTIKITGVNDAPVAVGDTATVIENGVATGTVAGNDRDADAGARLSYALVAPVAGLTLAADGSYRFDATSGYDSLGAGQSATVVADYRVTDDQNASSTAQLTIKVTGTNDAPVVSATDPGARGAVTESGNLDDGTFVAGVSTASGQLSVSDVDTGATARWAPAQIDGIYGQFAIAANGVWSYVIDNKRAATEALVEGASANDSFTATVTDDKGATATQTVRVTVTGTNDAPNVRDASVAVTEGNRIDGQLTATDRDADPSDRITYALSAPVAGLSVKADGHYSFDAGGGAYQSLAQGEVRDIVANIVATDVRGARDTAQLSIRVTGVNDAPVAQASTVSVVEDQVAALTFDASDRDAGARLSYRLLTVPDGVYGLPNGSFRFDASDAAYQSLEFGQTRSVPIDYEVTDEYGATARSTLTVVVIGTTDATTAREESAAVKAEADAQIKGALEALKSDPNATLQFTLEDVASGLQDRVTIEKDGKYTVDVKQADFAYLEAGETDVVVIPFKVVSLYTTVGEDTGNGGYGTNGSATSTISVTVTGVNDAPIAVPELINVLEDMVVTGNVALNDIDPDEKVGLTYTLKQPIAGLTLNANGTYVFDAGDAAYQSLTLGQVKTVLAQYTATDSYGASSSTLLQILVIGRNDAPTTPGAVVRVDEDATATGLVSASGIDGSATFSLLGSAAGLTLLPNGQYIFDARDAAYQSLRAGETMPVIVPYRVVNGSNQAAINTLRFEVTGKNDAPVARSESTAVFEDAAISGRVSTNDIDVDRGDTRTYALAAPVAGLTLRPDGSYTFDAGNAAYQSIAANDVRDVAARYTLTDAAGASSSATLTLRVIGTNDALTVNMLNFSGYFVEDTRFNLPDLVIQDVDSTTVSATLSVETAGRGYFLPGSSAGGGGATTINNLTDGTITVTGAVAAVNAVLANLLFVPNTDVNGYVTIKTSFTDGFSTLTGSGLLLGQSVNDAPVARPDTVAAIEDATIAGRVSINDSDPDHGDTLTYALAAPVVGLTLRSDGSYTFNAADAAYQSLSRDAIKTVVANYTVTDAAGVSAASTLTVRVTGTNDAPVIDAPRNYFDAFGTSGYAYYTVKNQPIFGFLPGRDVDADDTVSYSMDYDGAHPGLTISSTGQFQFVPTAAAYQALEGTSYASIGVSYQVIDQNGATATALARFFVFGQNDAPVARPDSAAVMEDAVATGTVASNDSEDFGTSSLTYMLAAPVAGLVLNADGTYRFDAGNAAYQSLAAGQARDVVATYTATDLFGEIGTTTLTITVTGVDEPLTGFAQVNAAAFHDGSGGDLSVGPVALATIAADMTIIG